MVGANITIPRPAGKNVFFSPVTDMLVLGGVSILCFAVLQAIDFIAPWFGNNSTTMAIAGAGAIIVNYPHYSATYYRVYRSAAEMRRYQIVAIWLPVVLLALTVASFVYPSALAPYLCKAYFLTSSYHYAGQSYGIALIFAHKAGLSVNRLLKLGVGLPLYTSALLFIVGDEVIANHRMFSGVQMWWIGWPNWSYLLVLMSVVFSVVIYVAMSFFLASQGRRLPLMVHIIVLCHLIWFTLGMRLEIFLLMVPFFHCLQYLLITTFFRFQELQRSGQLASTMTNMQFFRTLYFWRYYAVLLIVGLILFNAIPMMISYFKFSSLDFAYAVIYSFINLHHFLLDGEIWKLRKPDIGKALLT